MFPQKMLLMQIRFDEMNSLLILLLDLENSKKSIKEFSLEIKIIQKNLSNIKNYQNLWPLRVT